MLQELAHVQDSGRQGVIQLRPYEIAYLFSSVFLQYTVRTYPLRYEDGWGDELRLYNFTIPLVKIHYQNFIER